MPSTTYRLAATQWADILDVTVESGQPDRWVPVQQWSIDCTAETSARERRKRLEAKAAGFGWDLPGGRWPRMSRNSLLVLQPLAPRSWRSVLKTASAFRREWIEDFVAMDTAWRGIVVDAMASGETAAMEVAAATEMTRWRVYQILKDPGGGGEAGKVALTTAQHRKKKPA